MLDAYLTKSLLKALPKHNSGFQLMFVGDPDQLPSVGPGKSL